MDSNSVKRQLQQKRGRPTTADEDKILDSLSSRDRLRLWQMVDFDPCIDITKVELPALPAGANDSSVLDEELDPFEIARLKADKTPRQRPSNVNQPQPTFWRSTKPSTNQPSTPLTSTTASSPTTRKHSATSPPSSLNRTNSNSSNSLMTQDSVKNILQKKLGRPRTRAEDAYINKLNARDCARIAQIIQHSEEGLDITKIELVPIRDESDELPRSSSLRVNSQPSTPLHRTQSDRDDKSPLNKKEPTDELDDLPIYSASSLQTKIDNEKAVHSNHMTEMCDSRKARVPKFSGQNSNIKPSISSSRAQESDADARIAKLRQRFQEGTGKQVVAQTARPYSTSLRQPFQNLNTPTAPSSTSTSSPSYSMALVNTNSQSQQSFKSAPLTGEARLYQQKLQQKLGQFSIGPKKRIL